MSVMTGKKALLEMLCAEGVRYIFGNPGTSEGPFLQALLDYPDLEYVLTTQETTAMGMADGYARATGLPSFVSLHIDTGLANGISLLHNAKEGGTPMVVTSANKDIRQLAEGRTDLAEMVRLFTKWSAEATHPEQVPGLVRRGFNEAKPPPTGPVYVGFSANALEGEAEVDIAASPAVYRRTAPDRDAIADAVDILANASSPVLIVGDRVAQSDAAAEAVRLAELLGARVYSTIYSEVDYPTGHPQYLGVLSPGLPACRETLSSADVVVAVGTNVFSGLFYTSGSNLGPGTKLVHIDSASREIGKSEPTDVGIAAVLPDDAVIADDAVSSRGSMYGAIDFNEPGSLFGARGGSLGWGMGGAMGVKLALPDRPVVGIVGDGSAMMAVQALWTAVNSDIPVVYVICNNRSYRVLKVNMNTYTTQVLKEEAPSRYIAMDFPIPLNLAGMAEAIGVYGRTVERPEEVGPAMEEALQLGKPALLDMVIDGSV